MADFPASPTVGQVYTLGSLSWQWNGSAWDTYYSANSANIVYLDSTQTLTAKTLTSPHIDYPHIRSVREECTVDSTTAITGTVNFSYYSQGMKVYTANAAGNFTINVRGDAGVTLANTLAVAEATTIIQIHQNGATPYYMTSLTIDGNAQAVKWYNGLAPTAGNANSLDVYTFTILKTSATPTYLVFGTMAKYA